MRKWRLLAIPTVLQDPTTRKGTYPNITHFAFPGNQIPVEPIRKSPCF